MFLLIFIYFVILYHSKSNKGEMIIIFCPNCGNQINDNEKFCSKCGKAINPEDERVSLNKEEMAASNIKAEAASDIKARGRQPFLQDKERYIEYR